MVTVRRSVPERYEHTGTPEDFVPRRHALNAMHRNSVRYPACTSSCEFLFLEAVLNRCPGKREGGREGGREGSDESSVRGFMFFVSAAVFIFLPFV